MVTAERRHFGRSVQKQVLPSLAALLASVAQAS